MNSIQNLLLAPLKSFDREVFNNHLKNLSFRDRKKLIKGICINKFSSIYLNYIKSNKIHDLFNSDEIQILKMNSKRLQIQNLEIVKEVLYLEKIFMKYHLNPVFLKGVALMDEYEDLSLRPSYDIDILFKEEEVFKAYLILKDIGYKGHKNIELSEHELKKYSKKNHHLPNLCRNTNINIELHHRVTSVRDFEKCPLSNNILKNKVPFNFHGATIFKPDLNDLLVHLILHYSIQNLFNKSLRIFFDINQIEKNYNINWEKVYLSNENVKLQKAILLTLGVLNKNFKITKSFDSFKNKFSENFPSDEIIEVCFNKSFDIDQSIHPFTLAKIAKSDNYLSIFKEVLRVIYNSKEIIIHERGIDKKNNLKILYFSMILFLRRIRIYSFSILKLIFMTGKVSKDYNSIKKIQKWIN